MQKRAAFLSFKVKRDDEWDEKQFWNYLIFLSSSAMKNYK